tara:strand:+ start:28956 stop:29501 length:546 start_codon:yes stop_codon:yes gene_type:complete
MNNWLVGVLSFLMISCASAEVKDVPNTVDYVDVKQYMGLWYEIGRFDNSFQRKCGQTTAEYSLLKSGKVKVVNSCKQPKKHGKLKVAKAIARIADKESNSKLKVSFVPILKYFGVFAGDYWILALDENYQHVLVGDSNRKFLWILSRTPVLAEQTIQELLSVADREGFDTSKFKMSPTWVD